LTNCGIPSYTRLMAKGPTGNKQQLLIALGLSQGKSPQQLIKGDGFAKSTVYDIKKAVEAGWKPDLSEEAIAAAPPSPGFGKKGGGTHLKEKKESHGESNGKKPPQNTKKELQETGKPAPAYLSLAAIQIRCQYTPIMYMARLAAEEKWGFPGDSPFEDFIDTVLYHFFKDRGITLQGYIVDDEVEGGGDGEIKKLQEQITELQAILKGGAEGGKDS
jgi:hypothetical protein